MGCFFAQNLTVFEKPKPKNQCERGIAKPSLFSVTPRTIVREGTVVAAGAFKGAPCD
jgi:hypothetical protein